MAFPTQNHLPTFHNYYSFLNAGDIQAATHFFSHGRHDAPFQLGGADLGCVDIPPANIQCGGGPFLGGGDLNFGSGDIPSANIQGGGGDLGCVDIPPANIQCGGGSFLGGGDLNFGSGDIPSANIQGGGGRFLGGGDLNCGSFDIPSANIEGGSGPYLGGGDLNFGSVVPCANMYSDQLSGVNHDQYHHIEEGRQQAWMPLLPEMTSIPAAEESAHNIGGGGGGGGGGEYEYNISVDDYDIEAGGEPRMALLPEATSIPAAEEWPADIRGGGEQPYTTTVDDCNINPDHHIEAASPPFYLDGMPLLPEATLLPAAEESPHDIGGGGDQAFDITYDYEDWKDLFPEATLVPAAEESLAHDIGGGGEQPYDITADDYEDWRDLFPEAMPAAEESGIMISLGHRFLPTDEELIKDGLRVRFNDADSTSSTASGVIKNADIYEYLPQELSDMEVRYEYKDGKMYFYTDIKKMGPTRTDRRVKSGKGGFWKATQKPKPIIEESTDQIIGFKTPLAFYDHNNAKTPWLMSEYKLPPSYYHSSHQPHLELVLAVIYPHRRRSSDNDDDDHSF